MIVIEVEEVDTREEEALTRKVYREYNICILFVLKK